MNQFLSEVARVLATSDLESHQAFKRLARLTVPPLADFCFIFLVEGDTLRCVAAAHVTREGERLMRSLNRVYKITRNDRDSSVAQVVRMGRPLLRPEIRPEDQQVGERGTRVIDLHRQLAARSAMVVPIIARGDVLGCLTLCYSESGRRYTPAVLPVAEQVALQLALAIDNARLAHTAQQQALVRLKARPMLTRLRHAVEQLQASATREERRRLIGQVDRHQRALSRLLDDSRAARALPTRRPRARL